MAQVEKNQQQEINLSNAAHPYACIFTFIFKGAAFFVYLIVGNMLEDVDTFIIVVLLAAIDFWTVKNVTGRLLVGLRWWTDFDQNGKQIWRYQSYDQQFDANPVDKTFFWMSQLISTGVWSFFLVIKILSLSAFWSMLVFINWTLSATNLYGYYKCRGEHNKKIDELRNGILVQAGTSFFSKFFK